MQETPIIIRWLIPQLLGGTSRPGLTAPLAEDIAVLKAAGIHTLVSLTKEWSPPVDLLERKNITSLHIPIKDMHAPSMAQAKQVCQAIDSAIEQGQKTVLHCKAGKGRTGTLLTAYDIWLGASAEQAIEKARKTCPDWIETREQIEFLARFAGQKIAP